MLDCTRAVSLKTTRSDAIFEVVITVKIHVEVFCFEKPCNVAVRDRRFGELVRLNETYN